MLLVWVLFLVLDQIAYLTQPIMIFRDSSLSLPVTTWNALPPIRSLGDALLTRGFLGGALPTNGSLGSALLINRSWGDALQLNGSPGKYVLGGTLINLSLLCLVFSSSFQRSRKISRILRRFKILVYFKQRNKSWGVVIWQALIMVYAPVLCHFFRLPCDLFCWRIFPVAIIPCWAGALTNTCVCDCLKISFRTSLVWLLLSFGSLEFSNLLCLLQAVILKLYASLSITKLLKDWHSLECNLSLIFDGPGLCYWLKIWCRCCWLLRLFRNLIDLDFLFNLRLWCLRIKLWYPFKWTWFLEL